MKRSMAWILGALTLAVAFYLGNNLRAVPAPASAPPTRVAMLNLRWVAKNYTKYRRFVALMEKEQADCIATLKEKQKASEELTKEAEQLAGPQREAKERAIRNLQREMEDLHKSVQEKVQKLSNDEMVAVYKAIRVAATKHAKENNIDVVLDFAGPVDKEEADSPELVMRIIQVVACVPMYVNPSVDISVPVLKALNAAAKKGEK